MLMFALNSSGQASGDLYWDDGESLGKRTAICQQHHDASEHENEYRLVNHSYLE